MTAMTEASNVGHPESHEAKRLTLAIEGINYASNMRRIETVRMGVPGVRGAGQLSNTIALSDVVPVGVQFCACERIG